MNFLKKFADVLLRGTAIVTGLQPLIGAQSSGAGAVVTKIESELTNISALVATAEVIGQSAKLAGPDKAKAIAPLVAQEILKSSFMLNKKIADPVKFQAACTAIGGDIADLLSSLHEDGIESTNKA